MMKNDSIDLMSAQSFGGPAPAADATVVMSNSKDYVVQTDQYGDYIGTRTVQVWSDGTFTETGTVNGPGFSETFTG